MLFNTSIFLYSLWYKYLSVDVVDLFFSQPCDINLKVDECKDASVTAVDLIRPFTESQRLRAEQF